VKIEVNEKIEDEQKDIEKEEEDDNEFVIDFTTSSAIHRVSLKFLVVYIPIFWFSGIAVATFWYGYTSSPVPWIIKLLFLPLILLGFSFLFIFSCFFFSKLLLIFINLIHEPKEGIFRTDKGDNDFEFWKIRTEIKKITLWLIRNWPLPWIDVMAFRWFSIKMDFSSHLTDAWCDAEFISFGKHVTVGQGAVIMSSMVVGNYLIIKKIRFDDYALIGGQSTIAPGTHIGEDTVIGAVSTTTLNQDLEDGWIYSGIPARKLKLNKYAEMRRDIIHKVDVDEEEKIETEHEVNIDDDKKHLIKRKRGGDNK
jgi:carbonic anhydrase/acetyltransferase-like protein (isoleucine patch superfamily)